LQRLIDGTAPGSGGQPHPNELVEGQRWREEGSWS
jgi:hypothetical protein